MSSEPPPTSTEEEATDPTTATISENAQILLLAAQDHNIDVLRSLLRNQTPNVQDPSNLRTPLHAAIASCEGFVEKNADKDKVNGSSTAGDENAGKSNGADEDELKKAVKTLELLLQNGAIWNSLDMNNETPGCIAYKLGMMELYEVMVDAGVRAELLFGRLEGGGYMVLEDDDEEMEEDDYEVSGDGEGKEDGSVDVVPELVVTTTTGEQTALEKAMEEDKPVTSDAYLSSELAINEDKILDEDLNGVMMSWESSIMSQTADLLLPSEGLRVLNIGYGMGIIDGYFQLHSPSLHHIIEAHPQILQKLSTEPISTKPGVTVHAGRWQEVVPQLVDEGVVFDAIYFDTFAEDYDQLKLFFEEYVIALMDSKGRFGFFNGLGADRQISYDVYKKVVDIHLMEAGLDVEWKEVEVGEMKEEWKGVRRRYWELGKYWLPICRFIG